MLFFVSFAFGKFIVQRPNGYFGRGKHIHSCLEEFETNLNAFSDGERSDIRTDP